MELLKEKARLSFDILKKFAPYMDHSNELYQKIEVLLDEFETLVESFRDIKEEEKSMLRSFMASLSEYADENEQVYNELKESYSYLSKTTTGLVQEYKSSLGG